MSACTNQRSKQFYKRLHVTKTFNLCYTCSMPSGGKREGADREPNFAYPDRKRCTDCKRVLPGASFYLDASVGRLRANCKECARRQRRLIYDRSGTSLSDLFAFLRSQARRRGWRVTLTFDEFCAIRSRPCIYGGGEAPAIRIGIDRKNSAVGYSPQNSVPACGFHNEMKNRFFSFQEMLFLIKSIPRLAACANGIAGRRKLPR